MNLTRTSLGGDRFEILGEKLFAFAFEFEEHNAIAELGVTGDDASANADRGLVEPKGRLDVGAEDQGHHQLEVTAAATQIGGLEAEGNVAAFLAKFDRNLHGVAPVNAAIGMSEGRALRVFVGENHDIAHTSRRAAGLIGLIPTIGTRAQEN